MTPTDQAEPVVTYHSSVPFGEQPPPIDPQPETTDGFAQASAAVETPRGSGV